MSIEDIHVNVDVLERIERGELVRKCGQTDDGRTRYYIERREKRADSFETTVGGK